MGTAIVVELWSDEAAAGEAAIDAVMARDAPHRPRDEPAQGRLRAVAHQPRRRRARRCALSDEMVAPAGAGRSSFSAAVRRRLRHHLRRVGQLYDYRQRIRPERRGAGRARAPRSAGATCILDRERAHACASRAPACASTSAASPRATRSTTPPRSCARRGIRHAIVSAGGDSRVDRRPARPALDDRHPRPAPRRRGGRGAAARGRRRSRPRATTNATSSTTACASTTSSIRRTGTSPSERAQRDDPRRGRADERSAVEERVRARRRRRACGSSSRSRASTRSSSTPRAPCTTRPGCWPAAPEPGNDCSESHDDRSQGGAR